MSNLGGAIRMQPCNSQRNIQMVPLKLGTPSGSVALPSRGAPGPGLKVHGAGPPTIIEAKRCLDANTSGFFFEDKL